jgi:hypothetical protein
MASKAKTAADMAYKAGKQSLSIVWGEDATDEQRTPGMHHCPFSPGDPQREEWARGLKDALGGDRFDPATILKQINDELKGADNVR